jgi:glycosyltransferase involved in cell wall biosynthesis
LTVKTPKLLSVVVPAHNEAAGIHHAIDVMRAELDALDTPWEIIVIDDGSRDATFGRVSEAAAKDARIKGIRLSRNFGKESALLAGLRAAAGYAVITLDADLQHPPALFPRLLQAWASGAKVVDAVKRSREPDSRLTRLRAELFNALASRLGGINLKDSSDYKLLDREVVDIVATCIPERHRFYRGLCDWVGFEHRTVEFDVQGRVAGEGKWTILGLAELAMTATISFTSAPLRIVTVLGAFTLVFGLIVATEAVLGWVTGRAVSGFTTTIITLLILASTIMISLGVIGEYIAKIYDEIKLRPAYLVAAKVGWSEMGEASGALPTDTASHPAPHPSPERRLEESS